MIQNVASHSCKSQLVEYEFFASVTGELIPNEHDYLHPLQIQEMTNQFWQSPVLFSLGRYFSVHLACPRRNLKFKIRQLSFDSFRFLSPKNRNFSFQSKTFSLFFSRRALPVIPPRWLGQTHPLNPTTNPDPERTNSSFAILECKAR